MSGRNPRSCSSTPKVPSGWSSIHTVRPGENERLILAADDPPARAKGNTMPSPHSSAKRRRRYARRRLGAAAIGTAIACAALAAALAPMGAIAALSSPASGPATPASVPPCATSELVVWLDTQGDGTLGSTHYKLELTNLSASTCALRGYPGVSATDLGGRQLGSAASRDSLHRPRLVTLSSGGGDGHASDGRSGQLPRLRLPAGECRRPARLPAEPDGVEGGPVPIRRLF